MEGGVGLVHACMIRPVLQTLILELTVCHAPYDAAVRLLCRVYSYYPALILDRRFRKGHFRDKATSPPLHVMSSPTNHIARFTSSPRRVLPSSSTLSKL